MKEDENEKDAGDTPIAKWKTLAEKKLDLLSNCTKAVTGNANRKAPLRNESATTKMSVFSLYSRKSCHSWINARGEQLKNAYLMYYLKYRCVQICH